MATVLSVLPPFAPLLMPLRIATGAAEAWQVALAAVLLVGAVWAVIRAAGHDLRPDAAAPRQPHHLAPSPAPALPE